ncbi:MAG: hypothetical protein RIR49_1227 [Actinomycetota bacterium]
MSDDFDPADPDVVKVNYDLRGWDPDQRAALIESLANAEIPHAWIGDELVVPEGAEDRTDEVFDRLEDELGPFAVVLEESDTGTEFQLEDWADSELEILRSALLDEQIPHRWDGASVIVASDAEDFVDDLLDAIESGDLVEVDGESEAPDGVLADLFGIGDRLSRDVDDGGSRMLLFDLAGRVSVDAPPFGIAPRVWATILAHAQSLRDEFTAEDHDPERIRTAAAELLAVCRPWV